MRIIPVIDLKDGLAVHAVKGERERYLPLESTLLNTPEPIAVARAFRDKLGLTEAYVADLDAILRGAPQLELIAALVQDTGMELLVDAGTNDPESVLKLLSAGASKVIIGAETLVAWEDLQHIRENVLDERLIFSLDMRAGKILSRCSALSTLTPLEAVQSLYQSGWREIILLDLARVGTQSGVDKALIAESITRFPAISLLVGGGIRDITDLHDLKTAGVDGALVATALHLGILSRDQIASLN